MTAQDTALFDAWLASDSRHRGAFIRASAVFQALESAVAHDDAPMAAPPPVAANQNDALSPEQPRHPSRWRLRAMAAAFAALIVVGGVASHFRPAAVVAGPEKVTLADGSIATLVPGSRIEVEFRKDIRRIALVNGKATFEVVKDRSRPFVVQSGSVYAQATGTIYSVERVGAEGGTVTVREGAVLVWPRDERDQATLVRAGGRMTLDPGPSLPAAAASAPPRLPPPALAQISLDNVPISDAVRRFNRINSTKILVADPAIGAVRIIGLYKSDRPDVFAKAAASIADAHVEYGDGFIVIKPK